MIAMDKGIIEKMNHSKKAMKNMKNMQIMKDMKNMQIMKDMKDMKKRRITIRGFLFHDY